MSDKLNKDGLDRVWKKVWNLVKTVTGSVDYKNSGTLQEQINKIKAGYAKSDHTHKASDVGAAATNHTHKASDVGAAATNHTHTASDVGAAESNHTHTEYASKSIYGNSLVSVGRKSGMEYGDFSIAFGDSVTASKRHSMAIGYNVAATGEYAFAHGIGINISGYTSAAFGSGLNVSSNYSLVGGSYNVDANNIRFAVGNGTSQTARANIMSLSEAGVLKTKSTITASTTADYAENFEWADGNKDNEDRVGLFVTLDGGKIRIADPDDDYILGIVSGRPFVLGNGDCDVWNGMFLYDEFNRMIMEPAPKMETVYVLGDGQEVTEIDDSIGQDQIADIWEREAVDADGNPIYEGVRHKLNPDYDPAQEYIPRADRPEWDAVGMLGVLAVKQDGTLEAGGYCMCGENGIATSCDLPGCGYRVTEIINDKIAKVVFREALPVSVGRKLKQLFDNAA